MLAFALLGIIGCSRDCELDPEEITYQYSYWLDTGWWVEPQKTLEVGIGTNRFIETPPGSIVSPGFDHNGVRYLDIALRGWKIEPSNVSVTLSAWVGFDRYAWSHHIRQDFKCRRWGEQGMGSLRLELDPSTLPRPTEVVLDEDRWTEDQLDTGFDARPPTIREADVRIEAVVTEPDGDKVTAETWWYVPR